MYLNTGIQIYFWEWNILFKYFILILNTNLFELLIYLCYIILLKIKTSQFANCTYREKIYIPIYTYYKIKISHMFNLIYWSENHGVFMVEVYNTISVERIFSVSGATKWLTNTLYPYNKISKLYIFFL